MVTFFVAVAAFGGYLLAYHTYGRWLSRRIFDLNPDAVVPSRELRDDVDFVPTRKEVIFGHHFTSIAGTGPIVGPAIAVFWGWLPALMWVVFGSIFIGAVHDLGALVVSLRNRGQTVGEVAGRLINPRARVLFLLILFFALSVVLAIFGLVIAIIFKLYPESVLSVWIAMPIAMGMGYFVYKRGGHLLIPSVLALILVYAAIYVGVEGFSVEFVPAGTAAATAGSASSNVVDFKVAGRTLMQGLPLINPVVAWTTILMIYCFFASVLPVWLLLQPRDYVNSHQLLVALLLLVAGLGVAGLTGQADLYGSTPAFIPQTSRPLDAPPIFPFLFITIACGACSGFHCLVSSGTTSKQIAKPRGHPWLSLACCWKNLWLGWSFSHARPVLGWVNLRNRLITATRWRQPRTVLRWWDMRRGRCVTIPKGPGTTSSCPIRSVPSWRGEPIFYRLSVCPFASALASSPHWLPALRRPRSIRRRVSNGM